MSVSLSGRGGRRLPAMVSLSAANCIRVASVIGDLSIANVREIRTSIERSGARQKRFIVSFEHCTSCDYSSISILVALYRQIGDGLVAIVPKRSPFRRILGMTALTGILPVVESVEAALHRLHADFPGDPVPFC